MPPRSLGVLISNETILLAALATDADYGIALARRVGMDRTTVSRTLRRLEAQGYLRSRWRVPGIRAQLVFTITPKGRRALAKAE